MDREYIVIMLFVVIASGALAYGIATSKENSKKIIKTVLIVITVCTLLSIIGGAIIGRAFGVYLGYIIFMQFVCLFSFYLGKKTETQDNFWGQLSLGVYLILLFQLPVVSNKHGDSNIDALSNDLAKYFGGEITPTQYSIIDLSSEISVESVIYFQIMIYAIIGCSFLYFCMATLRKNAAQVVIGSIISVLTAGVLYLDYKIFLLKPIAGVTLSQLGFSLSKYAFFMPAFSILTIITAYVCNKKDKKSV